MECSKCGARIQEGSLYCDKCGEDIRMVPDYEPELDYHLSESMGNITDEPADKANQKASGKEKCLTGHGAGQFCFTSPVLCVIIFCLLCAGIFAGIKVLHYYSYEHQLKRAAVCMGRNDYEHAEDHYRRALELDASDIEVSFALAEACWQKGNKMEYEYLLRDIISNSLCSQEQLERAYGKLISIYSDRKEYHIINEILLACDNDKVRNAYQIYLASPPEFNYEEGAYTKAIPLKMTSATIGRIYYTLDGTDPDSKSNLYTSPLLLEEDTLIKAVAINEYGVSSDIVAKEYRIHLLIDDAPQINAVSGTYSVPMLIGAEEKEGKKIYYTTDGSKPTLQSSLYTGPIPMPLGKSTYCFAYIGEDGTSGKVACRDYELNLDAKVSVEEAEALVVEYMLMLGKIYKEDGTFKEGSDARYLYQYQYVARIGDAGDFYVIAEVYRDEAGVQSRTGSYYAVDIHRKRCFKLLSDENNNHSLVDILINSLKRDK